MQINRACGYPESSKSTTYQELTRLRDQLLVEVIPWNNVKKGGPTLLYRATKEGYLQLRRRKVPNLVRPGDFRIVGDAFIPHTNATTEILVKALELGHRLPHLQIDVASEPIMRRTPFKDEKEKVIPDGMVRVRRYGEELVLAIERDRHSIPITRINDRYTHWVNATKPGAVKVVWIVSAEKRRDEMCAAAQQYLRNSYQTSRADLFLFALEARDMFSLFFGTHAKDSEGLPTTILPLEWGLP